jgi:DNA integrity scanning protein DisA with diadenylate cyclase activity
VAIIVSEQTGDITYSINGELEQNLKPEELRERLEKVFRQA